MSEETELKTLAKWKKSITQDGTLYTLVTSDTRTCLVKDDMSVEVRCNGLISNYPTEEQISELSNITELLDLVQAARFCCGTKEGFECKNILYAVGGRINTLCVRCPDCRILRKKYKDQVKGKKRKEYRCLIGVSEEERICVVKGCPGRDTARIRCYPIPPWDIDAWCANLKLKKSDVNDKTRVCSRHFEESCKNPRTLKGGARPTLNLGHNDIPFKNEKLILVSKVRVCCIVGCYVSNPPHQLFHFPDEEERLKQWLLICVIKDEMMPYKHKFICRKHFDPSMLHNNSLKRDAVPKMDALSWLENNANTKVEDLKSSRVGRSAVKKNLKLEPPEVQALCEIQDALISKMEVEDVDSDSDIYDSLQCRNVCLTCAKAFKDCETYRQGCYDLEKQLQDLQTKTDELKTQNEILMAELESDYVVYQEDYQEEEYQIQECEVEEYEVLEEYPAEQ